MVLKSKLAAAFTTAAILASTAVPAFAATTVDISGNGSKSDNTVYVANSNKTEVKQTNNLNVTLNIKSTASTGGNKASGNTGGNVGITTGDATTETVVAVAGGDNSAVLSDCGCETDDEVTIADNGRKSDNRVTVKNKKERKSEQKGDVKVNGDIKSKAKTGKNKAKNNIGGDTTVETGSSVSTTEVGVVSGSNVLE